MPRSLLITMDGTDTARRAGLVYVECDEPGLTRHRVGKDFAYRDPDGAVLDDPEVLARIRAIVIPPAWEDVWICARADGHIQATGRDARGRKQYRYHAAWRKVRDEAKFGGLGHFACALPDLRDQVDRDMRARGLPRKKVLATLVRLLETTLIRIGNDEYARANASYGLTTLLDQHARVLGKRVLFDFDGKSGVHRTVELRDPRLARIVGQCLELGGPSLFQYHGASGVLRVADSSDVNAYIREIAGEGFTAKSFRTWGATVLAAHTLAELGAPESERQAKKGIVEAVKRTSARLGNTPAVCRNAYIHPQVLESYRSGDLASAFEGLRPAGTRSGLGPEEEAVLSLIAARELARLAA